MNPKKQLLLLEVRQELERLIARSAAVRARDDERARLVAIADGMEKATVDSDDISFMRLDDQLNHLVAETSHNEYANRTIGLMPGLSRRFWYVHYKEAADLPLMARLYAELARHVAAGDSNAAGAASDWLVDYVDEFAHAKVAN